jgi:phospholipase/carboxylesterase
MEKLLECIEIETGAAPTSSVIWMHGLGADGNDFVPIVDELALPAAPIRFVFPHAPARPVTINGGYVMRAWYDIVSADLVRREDETGLRESSRQIEQLIEREKQRGSPANRIVLAGFSQGGAIALFTGLRYGERLGGIMALSTYAPLKDKLIGERSAANLDVPILMAHGTEDPVVSIERASSSKAALTDVGYKIEWRQYRMPHSVCADEIRDIGSWIQRLLM